MSEFQYYEFQAIDRSLTEKEMATLRSYSSRARITPSRFINTYSYGHFKGDVEKWMEKYFDAFLYMANWGTRRLILRFSNRTIDSAVVKQYCAYDCTRSWTTDTHTVVEFCVDECGDKEWPEDDDVSLTSLLPVRKEVSSNDYRIFYLGWLLCVQYGEVSGNDIEPPVPLGLGSLSVALESFVEFFNLDRELLSAAALSSPDKLHHICTDDIEPCIAGLSSGEKFNWLCRLALEDNANLQAEFRHAILRDCGLEYFSDQPRRTVAEITRAMKNSKQMRLDFVQ